MSKKNGTSGITHARIRTHDGRHISAAFPADQHVATNPQRDARARREALAILEKENARRDAIAFATPAPDEYIPPRRRPLDAPMATRIGELPDPLAQQAWDAIVADAAQTARRWWEKWQFTAALAVWSAACFVLGMLV